MSRLRQPERGAASRRGPAVLDHLLSAAGQRAFAAHAIGPVRGDDTAGSVVPSFPETARPIQLGCGLLAGLR